MTTTTTTTTMMATIDIPCSGNEVGAATGVEEDVGEATTDGFFVRCWREAGSCAKSQGGRCENNVHVRAG